MPGFVPNSTENVSVGGGVLGGYFFTAPVGTPLPETPWDDIDPAFENLGYISTDGIQITRERESDVISDMNGTPIANTRGARTQTWVMRFAEVMGRVMREVYGYDNVTDKDGVLRVCENNKEQRHRSYIAQLTLRDERAAYMVIPDGQCYVSGDQTINSTTLFDVEATITGFGDADDNTCIWLIESTETTCPARPAVLSTGTYLGQDLSKLGTFSIRGNVISGVANKIEGFEQFSKDPNEQEGYYTSLTVEPWEGTKATSSRKPERTVEIDEDATLIVFLGKDSPDATEYITFQNKDGRTEKYTFDVTAAEA